ncbi:unnamed protein product [Rhizophagus irregularis]|nr:unnamed protein product [Rhizophagus irregularis]
MTDEQRTNILEQDKLAHQTRYAAQQEQLKTLFLKIGCNNIDNYIEDMMEDGQVILSPLHETPPMLYNLLTSNDPNTKTLCE